MEPSDAISRNLIRLSLSRDGLCLTVRLVRAAQSLVRNIPHLNRINNPVPKAQKIHEFFIKTRKVKKGHQRTVVFTKLHRT